ncbi:MAG: HNH endonuclease signature motif containing protein [Phycisphaerae bacterium]|nr:HNH endonuclease signature motif containing protein [Phycisphaerae bacterium]
MARRRRRDPVEGLVQQIDSRLQTLNVDLAGLNLRSKVLRLVELQHDVSDLGVSVVYDAGIQSTAAVERIRLYLVQYVGTVIGGEELGVVSGISDYPRRIRELRREQGYQIASGASPDPEAGIDLRPDEYLLVSLQPDTDAARRWQVANRIRRSSGGSQSRLLAFLEENISRVVTTEELAYVAKDAREFGRRVRQLRTEQGFMIATRFTGRPDLATGQYVLESLDRRAEPHDRNVTTEVQHAVYARDNSTCISCGWNRQLWTRDDPRILELHHLDEHAGGGANTEENLVVLCSRCHDDVHAKRISLFKTNGFTRCERMI